MPKTVIKLLKHVQYGQERLYPNCDLSRAICLIAGKKTISDDAATALTAVGNCELDIETVKKRPTDKKLVRSQG